MDAILEARDVTKRYEDFTLGAVSLDVPRGSIVGIFGPNGAGKTTLVKVLAHQVPWQRGSVRVFGLRYEDREPEIKNRLGYVAQEPPFYDDRTVRWTARFAAPYFARWDGPAFHRLLEEFSINPLKKVKQLSGGQKKLLALAIALSHGAEVLILDEPAAGLDVVHRRALLERLRAFVANGERSVVVASHVTDGLDQVTDDVCILRDGRIALHEERDALLAKWKRVHFRDGALAASTVALLSHVQRQPFAVSALTGDFPALRDSLAQAMASGDAKVENATLEDVFVSLVKGA